MSGSITQWLALLQASERNARNEAAAHIWNRCFPRLLKLAHAHLDQRIRRREGAEDVLQNLYSSFVNRLQRRDNAPELANRKDLWRFLFGMMTNKAKKVAQRHLRAKRSVLREETARPDASDSGEMLDPIDRLTAREPSPEEAAEFTEQLEMLVRALPNENLRQIVYWKLEGYTNQEIARNLDCVERTVERKMELIRSKWEEPT